MTPPCQAGTRRVLSERASLDALTEHVLPGRVAETRDSTRKVLAATAVCAGIVPLSQAYGEPEDAPPR